jgi:hypothetical protein
MFCLELTHETVSQAGAKTETETGTERFCKGLTHENVVNKQELKLRPRLELRGSVRD